MKTESVNTDRMSTLAPEDGDKNYVAVLARGLNLLEAFDATHLCMGNTEIAQRAGMPKSTVSRLTYTLTKAGYLSFDADSQQYRLGPAAGRLARLYVRGRSVLECARPRMEALAERFGAIVGLLERDGLEMVAIHLQMPHNAPVVGNYPPNARFPLGLASSGRAYLAHCATAERTWLIQQLRAAARHGAASKLQNTLEASITKTRSQGFASSFEEVRKTVNGVAVSLRSPVDRTLLSVNVSAPVSVISAAVMMDEVGPALVEMVRAIELDLQQSVGSS